MAMVHGVAADDGSLALMTVDQRDPASTDGAAQVEISASSELPTDVLQPWELAEGNRLSSEALDAQESRLTAPADVTGEAGTVQPGPC